MNRGRISQSFLQERYNSYKKRIEQKLKALRLPPEPKIVYDPIRYTLATGGKRFRAVLLLLSCEAVGGRIKDALDAAAAIEVLHNFTLVHDDVMDNAELRRGKPTVHTKWDTNVAILSGDEMIAQAYRLLLRTPSSRKKEILDVYTDALIQVCEGQGFDKEFESRNNVSVNEYYRMIFKKTGVVISAAAEIGAIIGSASPRNIDALRSFGEYLGRAFQIMDDYLDVMGTEEEFGKKICGDIREGKKTYLLLKALEGVNKTDRSLLLAVSAGRMPSERNIRKIKDVYIRSGTVNAAQSEISRCTQSAKNALKLIRKSRSRDLLIWLADQMRERTS